MVHKNITLVKNLGSYTQPKDSYDLISASLVLMSRLNLNLVRINPHLLLTIDEKVNMFFHKGDVTKFQSRLGVITGEIVSKEIYLPNNKYNHELSLSLDYEVSAPYASAREFPNVERAVQKSFYTPYELLIRMFVK